MYGLALHHQSLETCVEEIVHALLAQRGQDPPASREAVIERARSSIAHERQFATWLCTKGKPDALEGLCRAIAGVAALHGAESPEVARLTRALIAVGHE